MNHVNSNPSRNLLCMLLSIITIALFPSTLHAQSNDETAPPIWMPSKFVADPISNNWSCGVYYCLVNDESSEGYEYGEICFRMTTPQSCSGSYGYSETEGETETVTTQLTYTICPNLTGTVGWGISHTWTESEFHGGDVPPCKTCEMRFCVPDARYRVFQCTFTYEADVKKSERVEVTLDMGNGYFLPTCWDTPDRCNTADPTPPLCASLPDGDENAPPDTTNDDPPPPLPSTMSTSYTILAGKLFDHPLTGDINCSLDDLNLVEIAILYNDINYLRYQVGGDLQPDYVFLSWENCEDNLSQGYLIDDLLDVIDQYGMAAAVSPLKGDLNRNGMIDDNDIMNMINSIASINNGDAYSPQTDINADGKVDTTDLIVQISGQ